MRWYFFACDKKAIDRVLGSDYARLNTTQSQQLDRRIWEAFGDPPHSELGAVFAGDYGLTVVAVTRLLKRTPDNALLRRLEQGYRFGGGTPDPSAQYVAFSIEEAGQLASHVKGMCRNLSEFRRLDRDLMSPMELAVELGQWAIGRRGK